MTPEIERPPIIYVPTSTAARVDATVTRYVSGELSRREFVRRVAILGLGFPAIVALLEACASAGASATPVASAAAPSATAAAASVAAPSAAAASASAAASGSLLDIAQAVVYPAGINSRKAYDGPLGVKDGAPLPLEYHDATGYKGSWRWKFEDFKADKPYKLAWANASSKIDTGVELGPRMQALATKLGCTLDIFDNNGDADTAIKNADLIIQGGYQFVNEFQLFPDASKVIYNKFKAAGIGVNFLAIEATGEPDQMLIDGDNFGRSQQIGEYIGKYVNDHYSGQIDMVILGRQPRAGAYAETRPAGFLAGLKATVPTVTDASVKSFDSVDGSLDVSQKACADLLTANPTPKFIVGYGSNDDVSVGMVRALEAAGRDGSAAIGGQGGLPSAIKELQKPENAFKASVFFDLGEWSWMTAIGVLSLMGGQTANYNLIPAPLFDRSNIADFPPQIVYTGK